MEAKKSLGQHFLHDETVLFKITSEVKNENRIIEIGGGRGALTEYLAKLNIPITVIEMDNNLYVYLKEKFKIYSNVEIINSDATIFKLQEKSAVVGNLPYNVSKRIIKNIILQKEKVKKMVFMVQKEVADTIIAQPKTKEYTKLSVFVQLFCKTKRLFNVKKGAFDPQPKVESSVIELIPYEKNRLNVDIDKQFFGFLNILFAHPRKTVKNNIKKIMIDIEAVKELLNKRPEELSIEEIYQVYSGCYNE